MSLASLLLAGKGHRTTPSQTAKVDGDLDALFRSNPAPPIAVPTINPVAIQSDTPTRSHTRGHKRKRDPEVRHVKSQQLTTGSSKETSNVKADKKAKVAPMGRAGSEDDDDDDEDEDSALEMAYLTRHAQHASEEEDESSAEEDAEDAEPPQHETHSNVHTKKRVKSRKKTKYVPPEETSAERDARTIFVGNVPIDVAKSKSSQKQLKKHFTSRISGAKVESLRFRSVAFATATAGLPDESGKSPRKTDVSTKQQRQKERAATWRETGGETSDREDHGPTAKTPFLTPSGKKRVAFIKADFHKEVDTVNVYVVFAHPAPDDATEMPSPIEVARLAVERCDGSVFIDHTLRVDRVGQWRAVSGEDDLQGEMKDPRTTLFVGNLDFSARDEDLRIWFEGVVSQTRGPRGVADADEEDGKWVQRVRIVRDRDTQLGKGFAYVRFADRECVDEVLALDAETLKFAKRTLRVQRCKVNPPGGTSNIKRKASTHSTPASKSTSRAKPVPAGDPLLGAKLAGLSKEDRKAAKASNVDRVQRRLAKKKARAGVERELEKRGDKIRDRERKKGTKINKSKPAKKGRIRSAKSLEKRNMKK